MGSFSSDEIDAFAKAIAREVVRELIAAKAAPAVVGLEPVGHVFQVGPVVVDIERHEASVNDRMMPLRPREFALLASLARNAGKVLSRQQLVKLAWPEEGMKLGSERTVDVHVRRLRNHLGAESTWLETIGGFGYKLNDR